MDLTKPHAKSGDTMMIMIMIMITIMILYSELT